MSRRLSYVPLLAVAALGLTAASAAADSIAVTARPTGLFKQQLTVNTVSSSPGRVGINAAPVTQACPADTGGGYQVEADVPQGSATTQLIPDLSQFNDRPLSEVHVCAYLEPRSVGNRGPDPVTAATDFRAFKPWGSVVGYNWLSKFTFAPIPMNGRSVPGFQLIMVCSAGTTGRTDDFCRLTGRVRVIISEKVRKKMRLRSRIVAQRSFNQLGFPDARIKWLGGGPSFYKALQEGPYAGKPVPATMTVATTSPIRRTVTANGYLNTESGFIIATYKWRGGGSH